MQTYDVYRAVIVITVPTPNNMTKKELEWSMNTKLKNFIGGAQANMTELEIIGLEAEDERDDKTN
jgi:hypothetical protein